MTNGWGGLIWKGMVVGRLAGRLVVDQSTLFSYFHKISYYFDKAFFRQNITFILGLDQTASTKMTAGAVRSFHGFGKKSDLTWYLPVKSHFLRRTSILKFLCI